MCETPAASSCKATSIPPTVWVGSKLWSSSREKLFGFYLCTLCCFVHVKPPVNPSDHGLTRHMTWLCALRSLVTCALGDTRLVVSQQASGHSPTCTDVWISRPTPTPTSSSTSGEMTRYCGSVVAQCHLSVSSLLDRCWWGVSSTFAHDIASSSVCMPFV